MQEVATCGGKTRGDIPCKNKPSSNGFCWVHGGVKAALPEQKKDATREKKALLPERRWIKW